MSHSSIGPFTNTAPLVLASGSPRRRELLAALGLTFDIHPSQADEPAPFSGEAAEDYARRMASMKTREVAQRIQESTVLGADTIVVLEDRIMGKPTDDESALEMLTALSGKTHQVITGYCILFPNGDEITQAVVTDVDMRQSNETELKSYIATGEPKDKAGAYAIQGIGTFLVTGIRGSYTNVVGLPLARVLDTLLKENIIMPFEPTCHTL